MTISIPEQAVAANPETLQKLSVVFLDENASLAKRFRALFSLKTLNCLESIQVISRAFQDSSALLKHEVAYVLGQMKNPLALPFLEGVLEDTEQDPMVRHEAAEAIGAIGQKSSIVFLERFAHDPQQVVRETVVLALASLSHESEDLETERYPLGQFICSVFASIDPAPAAKKNYTTSELRDRLLDGQLSLFDRYRAMFALRNRGDTASVLALAEGFGDSSALFRHEIAYVFGQMQHEASVPSLIKVLSDRDELSMVRHEAAEALGSIATPECFPVLKEFAHDPDRTVRDSCVVGLDMYEFEMAGEFQYAQSI
ncbi:deoxyhypusine hydroxylase [Kappamyces sp. JEL0680]|nr:deoxyhypusine hydroxylase [Kappamyces sp. JEL0680]